MKRILLLFGIVACWVSSNAQITAPFTESFDATSIPTGWTNTSASSSTNANWKFSGTPGNPSMSTSALYQPPVPLDHTGNAGSFAWVDGSTPNVDDTGLLTDTINASALTSAFVEFWYYSNNVTNPGDNMTLYLNFYDGTTWHDSIWGYAGDGNFWQYAGVDLSTYTISGGILFEFVLDQTTAGTAFYNDILLDDISVINKPSCVQPFAFQKTNITNQSVDLDWTQLSTAGSYTILYGPADFDPAVAGTAVTANTKPHTLTNLAGSTEYDLYMIANCGGANGVSDTSEATRFTTLVNCPAPSGLVATDSALNTITLSWTTGGSTAWLVEYGAPGFSPGTGTTVSASTSTGFVLGSLSASTYYEIYVRDYCASFPDTSTYVGPILVRTDCAPITAPYTNDFESEADGELTACWTQYSSVGNGYARTENLGAPRSGSQQLAIYSGSSSAGDTIVSIMPMLSDLTAGDKQLEFFAKTSNASTDLVIGTLSSDDFTTGTFTLIDTVKFAAVNTYEQLVYDLTTANGYNGTDQYVAFINTAGTTFDYIYIDDLTYQTIPACQDPIALAVGGVTDSSVTLTFTSSDTVFDYEYGPIGFVQGTNAANIGTGTGNPLTVSGLAAGTGYHIYIRTNCTNAGSGVSGWVGPVTFFTDCSIPPAVTLPILEDFEGRSGTYFENANFCGTDYNIDFSSDDATGRLRFDAGAGFAQSGNGAATLDRNPSGGVVTNYLDFTINMTNYVGASNIQLIFDFTHHGEESSPNDRVWIRGHQDSAWIQVYDLYANRGTAGTYNTGITINLDDTLANSNQVFTESFQIRFGQQDDFPANTPVASDGFSFDNIQVRQLLCALPTNLQVVPSSITATSAQAIYTSGGASHHVVEWGVSGFVPATGAQLGRITTTDTFYTITGLAPSSVYDVYVYDSCAVGGLSFPVGPETFGTACPTFSPATLPFVDGFESYTGPVSTDGAFFCGPDFSWSVDRPGGTGEILFTYTASSGPTPPFAGSQSAGFQSLSSANPVYLILTIDMSAYVSSTTSIGLSFQYADHADEPSANDRVWARGNNSDPWIEIFDWSTVNSSNWEFFSTNLDLDLAAAGQSFSSSTQIRWGQQDNAALTGADGFSIDDVRIEEIPCPDPSDLAVLNLVDTAATLSWLGNSSSYDVWFGSAGFFQGSLTVGGIRTNVTSDSLHVDTLTPNTCYEFVVKAKCANGDSSAFVGPFFFCTPCSPFFAPYTENFDGTTAPALNSCWTAINNTSSTLSFVGTSTLRSTSPPNSAEIEYWTGGSGTNDILLVTPPFGDFDNLKRVRFNVWDDDGTSDLIVGTMSNPSDPSTFTPYQTITEAEMPDQEWKEIRVFFGNYTGTDKYVAFAHGLNTTTDQFYIDDFIYEQPTCFDPTNFTFNGNTSTSVDLSWVTGGASDWEVEYGPLGFEPGSGTRLSTTTNTNYILPGLTPGSIYHVYVRDSCGVGDVSLWTGPLVAYTSCAPLSGTYTIGATGDYASFADAANALSVCGVSGPVTFNVQPGYYTDHLHLSGIPGARRGVPGISAANNVTFNGSGSDTLEWDGFGEQATVWVDSVSHVTFNNMYIINDVPSEGWGILITDNSDSIAITNNTVFMDTSGVFRSDKAPINVSGDPENDIVTGASVDHLVITGNKLYGGYYSASIFGAGTARSSFSTDVTFDNNEVKGFYLTAVYIRYYDGVQVNGNTIRSTVSVTDEDGIYLLDCDNYTVEENQVYVKDWALYINDGNDGATVSSNSTVINNMLTSENDYGMYLNDLENTDVFHNSVLGEPALRLNDQVSLNIQNNILTSTGDFAFESDDDLTTNDVVNYNVYYSTGANPFDVGAGGVYADLAAWQAGDAANNVNSLEGDPLFFGPNDLHVFGSLANDVGNNTLGITVDIDGDTRPATGSTIVDIGADEYTPVPGDYALKGADFEKDGFCLRNNDTIVLFVENIVGSTSDLSVAPLTANYSVTGPVNSSGTITVNTGTLALNDTLEMRAFNIDLSIPGEYTLNAYISPTADNVLAFNDTLAFNSVTIRIDTVFRVTPKSTVLGLGDSVELRALSPFFGGGDFHFTEIMHFRNAAAGFPAGGWPAYMPASVDEYVEITGVPGSDLAGYTFEQWNNTGTAPTGTITFPAGTVIGPNGTALFTMRGTAATSPADFLYDGSGGNTVDWQSARGQGVILKDPGGNIVDAVGYPENGNPYTFPADANVSAADWGGGSPGSTSNTCGVRLEGPDVNDATGWLVSSATSPQDPNTVNLNVVIPAPISVTGFDWSLSGTQISTDASIKAYADSLPAGTYSYVGTFNSPCGTFTDTAVVVIPSCFAPDADSLTAMTLSQSSASVSWDTTGLGGSTNYEVEFGPVGYTPGTGTATPVVANNTTTITGLTQNLCVDVYVRTACSPNDLSIWSGPVQVCPTSVPCDDLDVYAPGLVGGQSSLFLEWAGAGGDAEVSTTRAQSGTQSMRITDKGPEAFSDIVAYFDTIDNGVWDIGFSMYVESGDGAYYNIQQNHVLPGLSGTNLWGCDIYFDGSGTATVQYANPAVTVGTFSYVQGQWIDINTVIDLDNDSIWVEYNGTSTGLGWDYSSANPGQALQFNGVNFYSGVLAGGTYAIDFYMDDFCITPRAGVCPMPSAPTVGNIDCDNIDVNFSSNISSVLIQHGPTGFGLGNGTFSGILTGVNTYNIPGLTVGNTYDIYLANVCSSGDTSAFAGPLTVTTSGPAPVASFTYVANGLSVDFDATSSSAGVSAVYAWDYGDGNMGTGLTPTHVYTSGGNYNVTLTVTDVCGTDDTTFTAASINLLENALGQSLAVYPNPSKDVVQIEFSSMGEREATIRVLELSGKEVMRLEVSNLDETYSGQLHLDKLARGVYTLEINAGALNATRRLIKN